MNIKISKHLLLYKGYKLKCCIGKSGITSLKKEGDLATPKGTFRLGSLYYRNDIGCQNIITYQSCGVDIDKGNEVVSQIKHFVESTFTENVFGTYGDFGSLYLFISPLVIPPE